jgi:hypothetical protein
LDDRPRGPIRWERHAKPDGSVRSLVRLSARDGLAYRRLVAPLVPAIERSLRPGVVANRATRGARVGPWRPGWAVWRRATRGAIGDVRDVCVIVSDVRDCYGSVGERALRPLGLSEELTAFLRALRDAGVRGLPVGPDPSAILANAILGIADDEAAAAGCQPFRWVDDVVLVAAGRSSAQRAFDAWRRSLGCLGLEAHDAKTRLATTRLGALALLEHRSGSDAGPSGRVIIPAP